MYQEIVSEKLINPKYWPDPTRPAKIRQNRHPTRPAGPSDPWTTLYVCLHVCWSVCSCISEGLCHVCILPLVSLSTYLLTCLSTWQCMYIGLYVCKSIGSGVYRGDWAMPPLATIFIHYRMDVMSAFLLVCISA